MSYEYCGMLFNDESNNKIIKSHLVTCEKCSKYDLDNQNDPDDIKFNIYYCSAFNSDYIKNKSNYYHIELDPQFYTLVYGDHFNEKRGIYYKLYTKYLNKYYITIKEIYSECDGCGYRYCRNRNCRGSFYNETDHLCSKKYIANNINDATLYLLYCKYYTYEELKFLNINFTFNRISNFLINKMNNDTFQVILSYV